MVNKRTLASKVTSRIPDIILDTEQKTHLFYHSVYLLFKQEDRLKSLIGWLAETLRIKGFREFLPSY